jgi:hypothetical protein
VHSAGREAPTRRWLDHLPPGVGRGACVLLVQVLQVRSAAADAVGLWQAGHKLLRRMCLNILAEVCSLPGLLL